jgi:hypothetical protein
VVLIGGVGECLGWMVGLGGGGGSIGMLISGGGAGGFDWISIRALMISAISATWARMITSIAGGLEGRFPGIGRFAA